MTHRDDRPGHPMRDFVVGIVVLWARVGVAIWLGTVGL